MDIPKIGFGTWQLEEGSETYDAVRSALHAGYRLIDTAKIYGNERSVGQAIRESGVRREDIFVTTKLWMSDMGYDSAKAALADSLARLDIGYLDLYLIHWPGRSAAARRDSWKALEELQQEGLITHIGVSNYTAEHLQEMESYSDMKPYANQIEFHPFIFTKQKPVLDYCLENHIKVEAYSPLAQASSLENETLAQIAQVRNCTPAQLMLAWAIAHRTIPIPRSSNSGRIKQNLDIDRLKLSEEDIERINNLSADKSVLG